MLSLLRCRAPARMFKWFPILLLCFTGLLCLDVKDNTSIDEDNNISFKETDTDEPAKTNLSTSLDDGTTLNQYDYLLLALQWPPGVCAQAGSVCFQPVPANWTIHGLWPTDRTTPGPFDCVKPCPFNKKNINSSTLTAMKLHWPSIQKSNELFWRHEYCKHGTCCTDILPAPQDYFQKTIDLFETLDLANKLRNNGILPSNNQQSNYSFPKLEQLPSLMQIQCVSKLYPNKTMKLQYLGELRFKVDKTLAFSDRLSTEPVEYFNCSEDEPFHHFFSSIRSSSGSAAFEQFPDTILLTLMILKAVGDHSCHTH